jgi:hypothetical protein
MSLYSGLKLKELVDLAFLVQLPSFYCNRKAPLVEC